MNIVNICATTQDIIELFNLHPYILFNIQIFKDISIQNKCMVIKKTRIK